VETTSDNFDYKGPSNLDGNFWPQERDMLLSGLIGE
jgi:hypothetical protein